MILKKQSKNKMKKEIKIIPLAEKIEKIQGVPIITFSNVQEANQNLKKEIKQEIELGRLSTKIKCFISVDEVKDIIDKAFEKHIGERK